MLPKSISTILTQIKIPLCHGVWEELYFNFVIQAFLTPKFNMPHCTPLFITLHSSKIKPKHFTCFGQMVPLRTTLFWNFLGRYFRSNSNIANFICILQPYCLLITHTRFKKTTPGTPLAHYPHGAPKDDAAATHSTRSLPTHGPKRRQCHTPTTHFIHCPHRPPKRRQCHTPLTHSFIHCPHTAPRDDNSTLHSLIHSLPTHGPKRRQCHTPLTHSLPTHGPKRRQCHTPLTHSLPTHGPKRRQCHTLQSLITHTRPTTTPHTPNTHTQPRYSNTPLSTLASKTKTRYSLPTHPSSSIETSLNIQT
ncbi:hypothetical protein HNY73_020017 [Argiope bruennichi]|uniref:Uncharacterized protein n=1 Tax=Argiope bruennichi TaxID=94029 RepID=A0A8T0E9V9_ARGBR|nr:hypothetical protein HNY73_020017 [Argiope bruennichi]